MTKQASNRRVCFYFPKNDNRDTLLLLFKCFISQRTANMITFKLFALKGIISHIIPFFSFHDFANCRNSILN